MQSETHTVPKSNVSLQTRHTESPCYRGEPTRTRAQARQCFALIFCREATKKSRHITLPQIPTFARFAISYAHDIAQTFFCLNGVHRKGSLRSRLLQKSPSHFHLCVLREVDFRFELSWVVEYRFVLKCVSTSSWWCSSAWWFFRWFFRWSYAV